MPDAERDYFERIQGPAKSKKRRTRTVEKSIERSKKNIKKTIASSQLNLEKFLNPTKQEEGLLRSSNYRKFGASVELNEEADIDFEDRYQLYDQEQNYMNFDLLQQEIKTIWQLISQNNSQILVL